MNGRELAQQRAFAAYLRWVRRTSRIEMADDLGESALACIWSESVLNLLVAAMGRTNIAVFVLDHPGADYMVRLMEHLGVTVIVANSGGADGIREARAWLSEPKRVLAITLDGPTGPFGVAKTGVVRLGRLLSAPLVPVSVSAWSFSEGGGAVARVPYGHGEITVTPLERIPEGLSLTEGAQRLQRSLSAATTHRPRERRLDALWSTISRGWVRAARAPLFTDELILGGGALKESSEP